LENECPINRKKCLRVARGECKQYLKSLSAKTRKLRRK